MSNLTRKNVVNLLGIGNNRPEYLACLAEVVKTPQGRDLFVYLLNELDYAQAASPDEVWLARFDFCRKLLSDIACVDVAAAETIHARANGWLE